MSATMQNLFMVILVISLAAFVIGFAQTTQAVKELPRIEITINEPTADLKSGKLPLRLSDDRPTARLKIAPSKTVDREIRVILPTRELFNRFKFISVPGRLLNSRDGGTAGKIQAR